MKSRALRAAVGLCALGITAPALLGAAGPSWDAGETGVQLKDAPGRDLTTGRCIICHSLEYIPSNAPAMNRAAWQKTIQKMKDRFGAPLTEDEAKQILDYLDASYSGKSS